MAMILVDLLLLALLSMGLTALRYAPKSLRVTCWLAVALFALWLEVR